MREHEQSLDDVGNGHSRFTPAYLLGLLRRYARLMATLVIVITLASIGIVLALPNRFDASATVQIDPRRKTVANVEGVVSDLKADQTTVESEVEVIRSKDIALKVIELLDLRNDPEFTRPGFMTSLLGRLPWPFSGTDSKAPAATATAPTANMSLAEFIDRRHTIDVEPERDEVAAAFTERLKVMRVRATTLIEIRFSSSSAVKAARIANAIAEVYIKDQIEEKSRASTLAASLLEEKLADMRRRVSESERLVEQFKAEHNIFDTEGQILSERQLSRLMEQTVLARNVTAEAKAKYEQIKRLSTRGGSRGEIADVLQSHTIRHMKNELATLTRREAELSVRYGDKHPEMLKVRAEIGDAQRQLDAEIDRLVANLKNEFEVAEDREQQLAATLNTAKDQQIQTKEAAVKLKELQRDAQTTKQLFEALLTRYKQTTETQDMHLADARIVERAGVPLGPAAPKRKLIVAGAFLASIGLAFCLALLIDNFSPGISRPEDVSQALEHEHIASLPHVEGSLERMRPVRLMMADPHGTYAEAVRGLRHELDGATAHDGPRLILVASALPNEGKSAVASNLAHHFALSGSRTLLVDADLRKASLTALLCPAGAEAGLRECLEACLPPESAMLRDQTSTLCFLPARGLGQASRSASELLISPVMPDMMDRLRAHFDIVVLDVPPLLPVVDARIMADFADQIVFVMSWRRTPKELARKALRALGANERKVVGVVLNQVAASELADPSGYAGRSAGAGVREDYDLRAA